MSGKLKEVRIRIGSVTSTQQITKAMKMVSAAKLRRAQDAILKMRPYAIKMTAILKNLAEATEGDVSIELANERTVKKVLMVIITSDRGLCGGFNSNVVKAVKAQIAEKYSALAAQGKVDILTVGKKGYDGFKNLEYDINSEYVDLFGRLSFEASTEVSDHLKKVFLSGEYDQIDVAFNSFKNAATQELTVDRFLPIVKPAPSKGDSTSKANFLFEPDMETMVEELVPRILNTQFYRYLLDSNAAEHGARMTAMDQATENANDILKELKVTYNRARQAAITTELTEIVSGAAALSQS
ncbi:MAG: F-type H+-transporting ATPase subunit gamma [Limisphaerales bacterium]|jgi:F-type H+-transporting ATPase subunit gamma